MIDVVRILTFVSGAGYTEWTACKALGWGNGVISRWDKHSPSVDKIFSLSNLINVPVRILLGLDGLRDDEERILVAYGSLSTKGREAALNQVVALVDVFPSDVISDAKRAGKEKSPAS